MRPFAIPALLYFIIRASEISTAANQYAGNIRKFIAILNFLKTLPGIIKARAWAITRACGRRSD
jgi:hypothetical protein